MSTFIADSLNFIQPAVPDWLEPGMEMVVRINLVTDPRAALGRLEEAFQEPAQSLVEHPATAAALSMALGRTVYSLQEQGRDAPDLSPEYDLVLVADLYQQPAFCTADIRRWLLVDLTI